MVNVCCREQIFEICDNHIDRVDGGRKGNYQPSLYRADGSAHILMVAATGVFGYTRQLIPGCLYTA